jgi:hypothetical protein
VGGCQARQSDSPTARPRESLQTRDRRTRYNGRASCRVRSASVLTCLSTAHRVVSSYGRAPLSYCWPSWLEHYLKLHGEQNIESSLPRPASHNIQLIAAAASKTGSLRPSMHVDRSLPYSIYTVVTYDEKRQGSPTNVIVCPSYSWRPGTLVDWLSLVQSPS